MTKKPNIRKRTKTKRCYFEKGTYFFDKALQRDPKNFYALFGLADCYRGMNQQHRSVEYWNKILEKDPHNKVILTRAGDAYRNTGDYDKAVTYYNKALDIEFDTYAVLGLALISKGQGKYDEAILSLSRLIQSDAKNYRFYIDLADCYMKKNNKTAAIETLESFQKLGIRSQAISEMLEKIHTNTYC